MNTLARILSHGFAIILVTILALGLIYRGDLFPDMQLPEFLAFVTPPVSMEKAEQEPVPGGVAASAGVNQEEPVAESGQGVVAAPSSDAEVSTVEEYTVQEEEGKLETTEEAILEEGPDVSIVMGASQEPGLAEQSASASEVTTEPDQSEAAVTGAGITPTEPPEVPEQEPVADISMQVEQPPETTEEIQAESSRMVQTQEPSPVAEAGGFAESGVGVPGSAASAIPSDADANIPEDQAQGESPVEVVVSVEQEISAPTQENMTPYQLLAAAREAYWMHDYTKAETNYMRLAEQEPDNPDSYGELGNMYFSQGKWEQAADAYFEAGKRLVNGGHIQEAQSLVNVIRGLNGAQAEELVKLIASAKNSESQN